MGESMQTESGIGEVPAVLFGIALGVAGLSLLHWLRENAPYDPVAEAQRIARTALGISE